VVVRERGRVARGVSLVVWGRWRGCVAESGAARCRGGGAPQLTSLATKINDSNTCSEYPANLVVVKW
jgi:hypothetical protein